MNAKEKALNHHRIANRSSHLGDVEGAIDIAIKETLEEIKKKGYWKEGDITYMIEKYEYPHDENCNGNMCFCANKARRENPKKWKKYCDKED